jgi:deoxyribodipyrimidine photolyase-related protein
MKEATIIYPNQLYSPHPASAKQRLHVLFEDDRFFDDPVSSVRFHKQKLMLHRASMKYYEKEVLKANGLKCEYLEYGDIQHFYTMLENYKKEGLESIHIVDPTDVILERQLRQFCETHDLDLMIYETPNFVTPKVELNRFFEGRRHHRLEDFYQFQRKRMGILVDSKENPEGGQWSFEEAKRLAPSRRKTFPSIKRFRSQKYVEEARRYVERKFSDHPGLTDDFVYPINEAEARSWFDFFLEKKLTNLLEYRDSIVSGDPFVFCSCISSSLNIGLLSPIQILNRINWFIGKNKVSLGSVEAMVRRLIGNREFVRAVYLVLNEKQRNSNFFLHSRRLSPMWCGCDTGLKPLDEAIGSVFRYAYCSGTERLRVLGNLMLLCETKPDEVYRWFMGMMIDSYDWSVLPNIYGRSQFADGGLMVPNPSFYSSSDILKLSNYEKGDWCDLWDGLYWRFVDRHKLLFSRSRHLSELTHRLARMTRQKRKAYFKLGEKFMRKATR